MNQNVQNGIEHNGNGIGVALNGNPYIRRRPEQSGDQNIPTDIDPTKLQRDLSLDEDGLGESAPKSRKRRLAFVAFLTLVMLSVGAFAYMKFGGATKIDHQVKANRPGGIAQQSQQNQAQTADQQTEAAIAQAKEARRAGDEANSA